MRSEIREKIRNAQDGQVNLVGMNIIDEEIEDIANEINSYQVNAKSLRFSNNNIGDKGVKIISGKVVNLQHLSQIDLQYNRIGKEGFLALFQLKRTFPDLELALYGNQLTENQCIELLTNFIS